MTENEDVFNQVEEPKTTEVKSNDFSEESESDELSFSDKSVEDKKKEYGEHINCNGQVLTIISVSPTKPKTTSYADGKISEIPPTEAKNKKSHYYTAKLKVMFDNNVATYLPSITYFCDENGKLALNKDGKPTPTINIKGHNQVAILAKKILNKMSGNKFTFKDFVYNFRPSIMPTADCTEAFTNFSNTVSQSKIINFLIGKQVKIKTLVGTTEDGKEYFRNDIEAFV